jgi:hypothetical protein
MKPRAVTAITPELPLIRKLRDILGVSLKEMIFVGDALFPGATTIRLNRQV